MTTTSDPFASAKPWETSLDELLPKGNHVCKIIEVEGDTASTGNPQIKLKFENPTGAIRAWETYHSQFLGKIVALYEAAGLERPQAGEFDPKDNCRISAPVIARLQDKSIGVVVREEDDNRPDHLGEKRLKVQGYCLPERISDVPVQNGGGAPAAAPAKREDDIPFLRDEFPLGLEPFHGHENR